MQKETSVYYKAATFGVPMGILLTAVAACFIRMQSEPSLAVVVVLLLLVIPVILYRRMKKLAAEEGEEFHRLATLWVFGIYSIIFGTLICALATAFYLVVFNPSFVYDSMSSAIESMQSVPDVAALYGPQIDVMRQAIDRHLLPSPMELVISMSWTSCFFGSMLSLPLAFIVSRTASSRKRDAESAL